MAVAFTLLMLLLKSHQVIGCSVDAWTECSYSGDLWQFIEPGEYEEGIDFNDTIKSFKIYTNSDELCCVKWWVLDIGIPHPNDLEQCTHGETKEVPCSDSFSSATVSTTSSNPSPSPTTITMDPTLSPSKYPTQIPTISPTNNPIIAPTLLPSDAPNAGPTKTPITEPTLSPTKGPTLYPTANPSRAPSSAPAEGPAKAPTTKKPTTNPSSSPTDAPSAEQHEMEVEEKTTASSDTEEDPVQMSNITNKLPVLPLMITGIVVVIILLIIVCIQYKKQRKQRINTDVEMMNANDDTHDERHDSQEALKDTNERHPPQTTSEATEPVDSDSAGNGTANEADTTGRDARATNVSLAIVSKVSVVEFVRKATNVNDETRIHVKKCTDCNSLKSGTFHDGVFYCFQCWNFYEDDDK